MISKPFINDHMSSSAFFFPKQTLQKRSRKFLMKTKRPAFEYKNTNPCTMPSFLHDTLASYNSKRCQRMCHGTELLINHSHDMGRERLPLLPHRLLLGCQKDARFSACSGGLLRVQNYLRTISCVPLLLPFFIEPGTFERQLDEKNGR